MGELYVLLISWFKIELGFFLDGVGVLVIGFCFCYLIFIVKVLMVCFILFFDC